MTTHSNKVKGMNPEEASRDFHISSGETLYEASQKQAVALVFLRHFGCFFTRQTLRGLEELQMKAEKNDAKLVLIHMLRNGEELKYFGDKDPVARIADPKCKLYRSFGLGNGGIIELFGPRVWIPAITALVQGCGVGFFAGNILQMPGAFIFHKGQVIAAQKAESASDRPDLDKLFCQAYRPEA